MDFNKTMIFDGAMGTMIDRLGYSGCASEQLLLENPEVIERIHKEYVQAGADCIIASTFTASKPHLSSLGLDNRLEEINYIALEVARSSGACYVLGDIGPTGLMLEPFGDISYDELFSIFTQQAKALLAAQPDAIIVETMIDVNEALCALKAIKSINDIPIIVSCSFSEHGRTMFSGTTPQDFCAAAINAGADVVGTNCGLGPDLMFPIVDKLLEASTVPVLAQPNAGLPQIQPDGSTSYLCTEEEMQSWAQCYKKAGLHMMGTCCGSTPAYTEKLTSIFKA